MKMVWKSLEWKWFEKFKNENGLWFEKWFINEHELWLGKWFGLTWTWTRNGWIGL